VFLEYVLGCVIKYSLKDFEVVRLKDDADFVLYTVDLIAEPLQDCLPSSNF